MSNRSSRLIVGTGILLIALHTGIADGQEEATGVAALKRLGKTTELMVYPGEHHGSSTPSSNQDLFQRLLAWFNTYVKSAGSQQTEAP